jgi:hypothetical protein
LVNHSQRECFRSNQEQAAYAVFCPFLRDSEKREPAENRPAQKAGLREINKLDQALRVSRAI